MEKLYEALDSLFEELLEESAKTDFIDKFGQDVFNNFEKAKQRLKNNGKSVDYQQYLKMTKEELINFLASLYDDQKDSQRKRMILGTDKKIRGNYKYLGEKNGFKVYQPLDVQASMDLGVNTGWCTTGRYGHYGHPEFTPSLGDAERHWDDYILNGIKLYYFLDPKTMYGEYAVALYPKILEVQEKYGKYYINRTNVEIYNAKDHLDYSSTEKLPLDLIPEKIIYDYEEWKEIEIKKGVLVKYRGQDSEFTIPNNVTSIGSYAFSDCKSLESIVIPGHITSINNSAFAGCNSLTSIVIPNSVTSIGNSAFYHCGLLMSIDIPNSVTSIGKWAFSECASLTSIAIPDSVTSIGADAFNNCKSLTSINIPSNITEISDSSFEGCESLESINIHNSVTSIGICAFYGCKSLTSITIPNSVTSIGKYAFYGCESLESITIPDSVTSIGKYAFKECHFLVIKTNNDYVKEYCNKLGIKVQPLA